VFRADDFGLIATIPVDKLPPACVLGGAGTEGLQPLGVAGEAAHFTMAPVDHATAAVEMPTSVTLWGMPGSPGSWSKIAPLMLV
jgi:hypothetical protein